MTLDVALEYRVGDFHLTADFSTGAGITALFGRSGSGKTTLVNLIAGLQRPQRGSIRLAGELLVDTANGLIVPTHRRAIGYVFQDARLFPHLNVRQNLLYGHRFRRAGTDPGQFAEVVALLDLSGLLLRGPRNLSGGEQQRVAIGRALLARPRLLLLDEPLAALDAPRRAEILPYIERLRDELRLPMVYVSHSAGEVARLANQVVVLERGRVVAQGSATSVFAQASLDIAADEVGAILQAVVVEHDSRYALTHLRAAGGDLWLPRTPLAPGTRVHMHIRARDVMLATQAPTGLSAQNSLRGIVVELRPRGTHALDVRLDCAGDSLLAGITRRAAEQLALVPGAPVHAIIKSVAIDESGLGTETRPGIGDQAAAATE